MYTHFLSRKIRLFLFSQINNPDMRVQILKDFVKQNFPSCQLLDYALEVEKITTSKVGIHALCFFSPLTIIN